MSPMLNDMPRTLPCVAISDGSAYPTDTFAPASSNVWAVAGQSQGGHAALATAGLSGHLPAILDWTLTRRQ